MELSALLSVITLFGFWREDFHLSTWRIVLLSVSGVVLTVSAIGPRWLRIPMKVWAAIANRLAALVSFVLLTTFFLLVIIPVGMIRRLSGNDPLYLDSRNLKESYWRHPEDDERGKDRYLQQF